MPAPPWTAIPIAAPAVLTADPEAAGPETEPEAPPAPEPVGALLEKVTVALAVAMLETVEMLLEGVTTGPGPRVMDAEELAAEVAALVEAGAVDGAELIPVPPVAPTEGSVRVTPTEAQVDCANWRASVGVRQ